MTESKAYDDLIMDHIKNARNFRTLADATHHANGSNPLCGDELTVYIRLGNERIEDAAFQCTCCGISMASASIMTESMRGKRSAEVRVWLTEFVAALIFSLAIGIAYIPVLAIFSGQKPFQAYYIPWFAGNGVQSSQVPLIVCGE